MTSTGNPHHCAQTRRLAPDMRDCLAGVHRLVRAAARRGATEIAIPAPPVGVMPPNGAVGEVLCGKGFTFTPVSSEDGPYVVIAW